MNTSERALTRNGIEFIVQYYYDPAPEQTTDSPMEESYIEITSVTLRGKEIFKHLPDDIIEDLISELYY